jgi:hypothetical protein
MKAKRLSILGRSSKKKVFIAEPSASIQTERDFKDALLTVSIFANLFMLCLWVALQATTQYDAALVNFFIHR